MNRKTIEQDIGEDRVRYVTMLESDICTLGTQMARFLQFELLRTVANDPAISACGLNDFQKLKMSHDGMRWVIEAEAIIEIGKG